MMFYEKKDGFINYASMRKARKKYLFERITSGMASAFIVIFTIYYVGLFIAILFIKPEAIVEDNIIYRYMWGHFQADKPLIFGFIWCLWKGVVASVICAFSYFIALEVNNAFVVALLPFIYCTGENFVTGMLKLERYSITTTYILNRLSPKNMSIINYFMGVISFVLVTSIIIIVIKVKAKRDEKNEQFSR